MKSIFLFVFFFFTNIYAQNTYTVTIFDHDTKEPLIGATIFFSLLEQGGIINDSGIATITEIPNGIFTIEISFIGYRKTVISREFPQESNLISERVGLEHAHEELENLLVQSTRSTRTIEDIPTRIEFIAGEELSEKGNMKPGDIRMLLNESTGITTQQTSATSYNSSIRIQGLDGKYTQLLRDGLPLYSGYSGGLSLMQIAPLDLKQVEVIKGSSSTLYGGGAIAGLVNLISKTPEEKELSFMINGTSALGFDFSTFYSNRNNKFGTTIFASYNTGSAYDPSDIGLTAIPEYNRYTINPKIFIYPSDKTDVIIGLSILHEDRLGGNLNYIDGTDTNTYFESNTTDRVSSQFLLYHNFVNNFKLSLKNSFSFFNRNIEIPTFIFEGFQISSFSELTASFVDNQKEWIFGANFFTESFNQNQVLIGSPNVLDFYESTMGLFIQNIWNVNASWILESGLRFDNHSNYGSFLLPRLSLMLKRPNQLTMRIGGGMGYKTPTIFTEDAERIQFQNLSPLDTYPLEAEHSIGLNFDINKTYLLTDELSLSANLLFFNTFIDNPITLSKDDFKYSYQQSTESIFTRGMELNLKWNYDHFKLFIGYTLSEVNEKNNGIKSSLPLVSKHRLNNILMYEKHNEFWIGLEAYFNSPQLLTNGRTGKSYWIMGLMSEKMIGNGISVFLNFENFLNTLQSDFDIIYTGDISEPIFTDIYAPMDGFVINGGVKWKI
jgi:iron complex outermembrane receptor protein